MSDVALVTGASSGIGFAFAERLSNDGHALVVVARRKERLDALAARLGRCEVLEADLPTDDGIAAVESRAARGGVTLLVTNAGVSRYRPFAQERRAGAIVNVGSLLPLSGTVPPVPLPHRAENLWAWMALSRAKSRMSAR